MKAKFAKSFSDLLHYLLSGGITRLLPFLLLPYIAHVLNPREFGLYALYRLYITLGTPLLLMGLEQALFRFVPELRGRFDYTALGSSLYFITGLSSFVFLLTLWGNRFLNGLFFGSGNPYPFYYLPIFVLFNAVYSLLITFFSARKESRAYLLTNVSAQTSFFLIFVLGLYFGLGLQAFFYALVFSDLLIGLLNVKHLRLALRSGFDAALLKRLLRFGLPLMLVTLITYLLYQSDHYIIKYFLGLEMTGIYNYGYRFGAVILVFVTIANNVWLPRVYEHGEAFLIKHLKDYSALITLSCATIFWIIILIFHGFRSLLIPKGFDLSLPVLGIVGLSYIIYGHVHTIDGWLILKKRTLVLVGISASGLLLNIILNILFIPRFGLIAAAVITGFSFLVIWTLLLFYLGKSLQDRRLFPVILKVLVLTAPGLLLFSKLPVWTGFLLFLPIALLELRSNALLGYLLGLSKRP